MKFKNFGKYHKIKQIQKNRINFFKKRREKYGQANQEMNDRETYKFNSVASQGRDTGRRQ